MDSFARLLYVTDTSLFDLMSPRELARIKSVSRSVRQQGVRYEETVFGLHRLYGDFFETAATIELFRLLLLDTRALVSGSAVVRLLSRSNFCPSDLDVFVGQDFVLLVGRFLERQGYTFVPLSTVVEGGVKVSEAQESGFEAAVRSESLKCMPNTGSIADRYEFTMIGGVFNFLNKKGMKIQLVAAKTEAVEVILGFYSTLVMNFATATEVISLYPRTSFVDNRVLYVKQFTRTVDAARLKYEGRGWESYDELSAQEFLRAGSELASKTRWVGDPHCWSRAFSPLRGVSNAEEAYRGLKITSWQLFTPGRGCTRVVKNRMENCRLGKSYVITWNAMLAVANHPCFSSMEERAAVPRRGLPLDQVDTVSPFELDLGGRFVEPLFATMDISGTRDIHRVRPMDVCVSVWKYTAGVDGCTHSSDTSALLDGAVISFLHRLYPLLDNEYRYSWVLERLRAYFAALKHSLPCGEESVGYPRAHLVTIILQCMEDVDVCGLREDVDFQLEFKWDEDAGRVLTDCTIFLGSTTMSAVVDGRVEHAWTWCEDHMREAGLTVHLCSM